MHACPLWRIPRQPAFFKLSRRSAFAYGAARARTQTRNRGRLGEWLRALTLIRILGEIERRGWKAGDAFRAQLFTERT